ncbi:hypothetical protein VTK56DRAFT_4492 [Thermocarpiscus australiensis]
MLYAGQYREESVVWLLGSLLSDLMCALLPPPKVWGWQGDCKPQRLSGANPKELRHIQMPWQHSYGATSRRSLALTAFLRPHLPACASTPGPLRRIALITPIRVNIARCLGPQLPGTYGVDFAGRRRLPQLSPRIVFNQSKRTAAGLLMRRRATLSPRTWPLGTGPSEVKLVSLQGVMYKLFPFRVPRFIWDGTVGPSNKARALCLLPEHDVRQQLQPRRPHLSGQSRLRALVARRSRSTTTGLNRATISRVSVLNSDSRTVILVFA